MSIHTILWATVIVMIPISAAISLCVENYKLNKKRVKAKSINELEPQAPITLQNSLPTKQDIKFNIGTIWIVKDEPTAFILQTVCNEEAVWTKISDEE